MNLRHLARGLPAAIFGAAALLFVVPASPTAEGITPLGTCASSAQAVARPYNGAGFGGGTGDVFANNYTASDCVGLGQTNAIYTAGNACDQAGLPTGFAPGSGYAVVNWFLSWFGDDGQFLTFGPVDQQYDCSDTFSS